jgi:hypothetical protein
MTQLIKMFLIRDILIAREVNDYDLWRLKLGFPILVQNFLRFFIASLVPRRIAHLNYSLWSIIVLYFSISSFENTNPALRCIYTAVIIVASRSFFVNYEHFSVSQKTIGLLPRIWPLCKCSNFAQRCDFNLTWTPYKFATLKYRTTFESHFLA